MNLNAYPLLILLHFSLLFSTTAFAQAEFAQGYEAAQQGGAAHVPEVGGRDWNGVERCQKQRRLSNELRMDCNVS